MGLTIDCRNYLGEIVAVKPEYGWGWTRTDAPEIRVPAQVNGVPFNFNCRIRNFLCVDDELRGFIGCVEEAEHIYDGLFIVVTTRITGTFNFTDRLAYFNIELGADEPTSNDFPTFISGSPIVVGYGVVGASLHHIVERDLKVGVKQNSSSD
ncbi:MAG: hypothetical protein H7Z37_12245 [Pyrinomonadaceae bacterium]|nr:hypothetical protein [Pyrinomonadaceae bacterium]